MAVWFLRLWFVGHVCKTRPFKFHEQFTCLAASCSLHTMPRGWSRADDLAQLFWQQLLRGSRPPCRGLVPMGKERATAKGKQGFQVMSRGSLNGSSSAPRRRSAGRTKSEVAVSTAGRSPPRGSCRGSPTSDARRCGSANFHIGECSGSVGRGQPRCCSSRGRRNVWPAQRRSS